MTLPTTLANTQLSITDSAKTTVAATLLYVSPSQINYMVPAGLALGKATVTITSDTGTALGTLLVSNVAPSFFTADANGMGVPSAQFVRVGSDGAQTAVNTFEGSAGSYTPAPLSLQPGSVYLVMWGTGFRRHSANPVFVSVNAVSVPVSFVGQQNQFLGLDQINIGPLPATLAGAGQANVVVTVDGIPANTLLIDIQ